MDQEDRRFMCSVRPKERAVDSEYKKVGKHDGIHEEMREESSSHDKTNICSRSEKKNLVICGCDTTLKTSMSKLLMRKNMLAQESRSVRMWSDVELHGHLISLIKLPALNRLSEEEVMQQTLCCMSLCHPGVHVFLLVMPDAPLTDESKAEIEKIQKIFDSREHFILLFTSNLSVEEHVKDSIKSSLETQSLINLYGDQYRVMGLNEHENSRQIPDLLEYIQNMKTEPYSLRMYVKAQENRIRHEIEEQYKKGLSKMENKIKELEQNMESEGSMNVNRKQKMNLVLCGSDETLKMSIAKLIRKNKDKLHGHQIILVELPALTQLSEEEVMHQTLKCVSLCDPGIHVFLLIIPDAPVTDEDKVEMEEMQRIFSSRINKHIMILIIQEEKMISKVDQFHASDTDTETSIQTFGDQCFVLENSSQVPDLLQDVKNIVKQNNGSCYTTFMYLQAQVELERNQHMAEIEELRRSVTKTTGVTQNDYSYGVRIVMLGRTGVGKSATGNTILRREAFKSTLTSSSVTRECQKETSEINRTWVTVIDTPGLFDTGVDNVETRKEIMKCVSMAAPGPHVFLLVIQLGRFTKEEKDAVKMIQETFGEKSRMYTMVLFTRGDDLRGTTFQDFIKGCGSLQNLVQQCGNRYHVFNNNDAEDQMQVSELLEKIDRMVAVNGGSFYTNEMFQNVEKNIREEQERIMKDKEVEIKKKEEELRDKYEDEIKQMKKENEREKQEMQTELRKRENELKKREEEIKKETDENIRKELQRKLEEKQREFEQENKKKEKSLQEHLQNLKKYLVEKNEKEKQTLKERIQYETRKRAECEFVVKLEKELSKALKNAEEKHEAEKTKVLREAEEKHEIDKAKALREAEEKHKTEHAKALQEVEEKHKTEKAKALQEVEEKHKTEKAKALQEVEKKYKTEKAKVLQEVEQKHETEVAKALQEAKKKHETERVKALQENEEKCKREVAKVLQEAEKKQETEVAKAIKKVKENHETERVKALQAAEEKHKRENAKVLQEAEEKHKTEKAKALQATEEKYKTEKAKALHEAEEKHKKEVAEAKAKVPYRSKRAGDWSHYVPVLGGAAGGLVGTVEDIIYSIGNS